MTIDSLTTLRTIVITLIYMGKCTQNNIICNKIQHWAFNFVLHLEELKRCLFYYVERHLQIIIKRSQSGFIRIAY